MSHLASRSRFFLPLKIFSVVVLVLMVAAVLYAATVAFTNWSSISV